MAEKRKFQRWTRMTKRRRTLIGDIIGKIIIRIGLKFAMMYGYRMMFNTIGIDVGIWSTILVWITSYWISSKIIEFIAYKLLPNDIKDEVSPWETESDFVVVSIAKDLDQLLFYSTDEKKSS